MLLALAAVSFFAPATASAQHGLSVDIGTRHAEDSTHVSHFSVGLNNHTDTLRGAQLNAISNISLSPLRGVQLSACTNISRGIEAGVQLAGMLNVTEGYMRGVQLSPYNYADSVNGTQIGLVNVAHSHPKGWQVGIVNYTHDTIAHKLGLINVNPSTVVDLMAFGGTGTQFNGAVRFRNRSTYNILGVGTHYTGLDSKFSGALFYRVGQYFQLSPRWTVSGDVGYYHIETFHHGSDESPDRLFSLQARLSADCQLSRVVGGFASVGYGDTRYYHRFRRFRERPIFEAGLTFRYPRGSKPNAALWEKRRAAAPGEELRATAGGQHPWWALAEVTGINLFVHGFDRFVARADFAQVTLHSWKHNFETGPVWDNDQFSTNLFMHPYHGNLYFNAARSQGLGFWSAAPYALIGSLQWEFLGENEPPAINDLIATTFGGICIGEITNRVSRTVLNDSKRGWSRFWREAVATLVNPMGQMKRFATGDAWRVRDSHNLYHDFDRNPVDVSVSVGEHYLADNGALFRGEHNAYATFYLEYGDPINRGDYNRPFDFFDAEATFVFGGNQPFVNQVHLLGRLWSTPMIDNGKMTAEFGIYQHFDYFDSSPVKEGSDVTPYRISEAAAFGPGVIYQLPAVGMLSRLEQRIFLNGILLGGTKTDYYNIIDRDYNMGSGFSFKSKTHLELRNFGRFILHSQYYRIFTWKGYDEGKLGQTDPLYLNAQGDKGNSALLVVNPMAELDVRRNWSLRLSGAYLNRRTHYHSHDDIGTSTFNVSLGITCHL